MSSSSMTGTTGQIGGTSRYGQPKTPTPPSYLTDPSKYQSFDRSALANNAIAQGNTAGANQMALAKARLAGTGGGRSSSANRQQMDIAGQLGQGSMNIQNQNALQGWQDKIAQMANENQFNMNNYGLAQEQYKTDAGLSEGERENKRNSLTGAFGPMGSIMNLFGGQ